MKSSIQQFAFAIGVLASLVAIPANAQLIYELNWDTTSPTYDQSDPGAITALSTVANGPGGVNARNLTFDTSTSPFSIQYFANFNTKANAATSNNASDYILSFQVRADGIVPAGNTYGEYTVIFNDATFKGILSGADQVTGTFQPITVALSDLTLTGTFDAGDFNAGTQRFTINQLGISQSDRYGTDAGNVLIFTDITVTQVPEPTALALLGLAGIGLLARRRR